MRTTRERGVGWALILAVVTGCGHDDGPPPPDAAIAGDVRGTDGATAAPPPGPAPSPAPAPAPARTIEGARLLAALKGFVARPWPPQPAGPPPGWLPLYPAGTTDGTVPSGGSFYAWSQLIHGGRGTVSSVATQVDGGPPMQLEFLVGSGERGYVANLSLRLADAKADFDEVASIEATDRIALDVPVFTWRLDTGTAAATVALVPRSIDGDATAFELCWLTRFGVLDRLSCSVHGRDHAATLEDRSDVDGTRHLRARAGDVPWIADPPAGTPAPPPVPHPIRYAYGHEVLARLLAPGFGSPVRTSTLHAVDGTASVARLSAESTLVEQSWASRISSAIDGARGVVLSVVAAAAPRYPYSGRIEAVTLRTAEGGRSLPGSHRVDPGAIYPLDVALLEAGDGVATVRALLRSIHGARTGHEVCWAMALGSTDRLVCSVAEVPGEAAYVEDVRDGVTRAYR